MFLKDENVSRVHRIAVLVRIVAIAFQATYLMDIIGARLYDGSHSLRMLRYPEVASEHGILAGAGVLTRISPQTHRSDRDIPTGERIRRHHRRTFLRNVPQAPISRRISLQGRISAERPHGCAYMPDLPEDYIQRLGPMDNPWPRRTAGSPQNIGLLNIPYLVSRRLR